MSRTPFPTSNTLGERQTRRLHVLGAHRGASELPPRAAMTPVNFRSGLHGVGVTNAISPFSPAYRYGLYAGDAGVSHMVQPVYSWIGPTPSQLIASPPPTPAPAQPSYPYAAVDMYGNPIPLEVSQQQTPTPVVNAPGTPPPQYILIDSGGGSPVSAAAPATGPTISLTDQITAWLQANSFSASIPNWVFLAGGAALYFALSGRSKRK